MKKQIVAFGDIVATNGDDVIHITLDGKEIHCDLSNPGILFRLGTHSLLRKIFSKYSQPSETMKWRVSVSSKCETIAQLGYRNSWLGAMLTGNRTMQIHPWGLIRSWWKS